MWLSHPADFRRVGQPDRREKSVGWDNCLPDRREKSVGWDNCLPDRREKSVGWDIATSNLPR